MKSIKKELAWITRSDFNSYVVFVRIQLLVWGVLLRQ